MRVVLDTNIFFSSVLGGTLKTILDFWKAERFTLVVSDAMAQEYLEVIRRPKFKIQWDEVVSVTDYLLQLAEFVTPTEQIVVIVADPTDNKFLEAAIAGKVDFIVSGDKHLLDLKEFRSIPILTGHDFLEWLKTNG
jgi:uncharacterized protein